MTKTRRGARMLLGPALISAFSLVGLASLSSQTAGAATSVGGPQHTETVALLSAPPSVVDANAGPTSNTQTFVWEEQAGIALNAATPVQIPPPASFPSSLNNLPKAGVIPFGTTVNSWYVHTDSNAAQPVLLQGMLRFDTPIAGIIVTTAGLDGTDRQLGCTTTGVGGLPCAGGRTTKYGNGPTCNTGPPTCTPIRGLEMNGAPPADVVTLVNPFEVAWKFLVGHEMDDMRVVTYAATPPHFVPPPTPQGYRFVAADGGVFDFGASRFFGSTGGIKLNQPVVGAAHTLSNDGYWLVASDGGIFSFGDALFFGSEGGIHLTKPVVAMAATADSGGYYEFATDGGVFTHGDATFYGSTGGIALNKPMVTGAANPVGNGYWEVASDGGVFTFGNPAITKFWGSTGGIALNKPIVGMAPTPSGNGYWLVASDGGVFAFGDAKFLGSTGGIRLNQPVVGMIPTPSGQGYWLVASDGGVFSFGDAKFLGSTGNVHLNQPIVTGA